MARDLTGTDREYSDFEVDKRSSVSSAIVDLVAQVIGGGRSAFNREELGAMEDIVALLTRIATNTLGLKSSEFAPAAYIRGGLYTSGAVPITTPGSRAVENVQGTGAVTTTLAEQITKHIESILHRKTDIGTIDTFEGMSRELVAGMYGQILSERGVRKGDVLRLNTGTEVVELDKQMEAIRGEGVSAENRQYEELSKTRAVRAKMDELAETYFDDKTYNELTKEQKKALVDLIKEGKDVAGNELDLGEFTGAEGKTYKRSDLSEADIDTGAEMAERSKTAVVVTDKLLSDLDETAKQSAKYIKAWSDVLNTKDIAQLQAAASRLKMSSITTRKGTEELADTMKEIYTSAELTGKGTEEVLKGYSAIANALDATGRTYSRAELIELYNKSEQFALEEKTGRNKSMYSATERVEMVRQEQVNMQNNSMNLFALREMIATGNGTEEQIARASALVTAADAALQRGDLEEYDRLNRQAADLANESYDMTSRSVLDNLNKKYNTKELRRRHEDATIKHIVQTRSDEIAAEIETTTGYQIDRNLLERFSEETIRNAGADGAGGVAKILRDTAELSQKEAIKKISEAEGLSDEEKAIAQDVVQSLGGDAAANDRKRYADALVRVSQDHRARQHAAIATSERTKAAEATRREQVEKNMESGVYIQEKGMMEKFSDALLHGEMYTEEQGEELASRVRKMLISEDPALRAEGLAQLRDKEGSYVVSGDTEADRIAKAKELVERNTDEYDRIVSKYRRKNAASVDPLEKGSASAASGETFDDSVSGKQAPARSATESSGAAQPGDNGSSRGEDNELLQSIENILASVATDVKMLVSRNR